jgi:hypothetical protein
MRKSADGKKSQIPNRGVTLSRRALGAVVVATVTGEIDLVLQH